MSNVVSQKEAVFSAVSRVLSENGVTVNEGDSVSIHLNRELRSQITNILVEGFNAGTIALDKTFASESDLRTYCSGLTSNWLRKDTRLNGGTKYVAQNPGSRVGSGDASLKAMRALLSTKTDPAEQAEIQAFIDTRVAEIKATRKSAKEIDISALPEELKHLVNS
jgi:hypothetical protein